MFRATLIFSTFVFLMAAGAVLAQAVVPLRAIRSQSVIGPDDVAIGEAEAPGALTDMAAAIGREARVTLYPGRPIHPDQIGTPALVERNQLVRMVYLKGSLAITTDGRALDRAGAGEAVRVMNMSSRQTVSGVVAADGSIEVSTQ